MYTDSDIRLAEIARKIHEEREADRTVNEKRGAGFVVRTITIDGTPVEVNRD